MVDGWVRLLCLHDPRSCFESAVPQGHRLDCRCIQAEDYADLILNSVALGFLIEVDNMLFAAIASDTCKHLVRELRPYRMRTVGLGNWNVQSLFWTCGIIAFALSFETWSYFRLGGKEDMGVALTCLCQVSGTRCVASQILGGDL
mmetsp:Transcript_44633/g.142315  ORF Transcript_44633/g.142315 Transcript_44633/m.142315 type:complete len:145 (+) Transcript_44633:1314-1748(+)